MTLPEPPDAHLGVVLLAAGDEKSVAEFDVSYEPTDPFAAYRLGQVWSDPTLLQGSGGAGLARATVYDECSPGLTFWITAGSEQPTCRSTVEGGLRGTESEGVFVRSASGHAAGPSPLIVVNWPPVT